MTHCLTRGIFLLQDFDSLSLFFLKVNKTTSESETVNQNENHFDGGSFRGGALTVMERVGGGVLDVR